LKEHLFCDVEEGDLSVVSEIKGVETEREQALACKRIGFKESRRDFPRVDACFEEFGGGTERSGARFLVAKAASIREQRAVYAFGDGGKKGDLEALSEFEDQESCGGGVWVVEVDIAFESRSDVMIEDDKCTDL